MKEKNFVRSNLNNYIKVKLTDFGRMIYRNSFVKLGLPEPKIRVDEEGYTRFQMHDFINVFGEYIRMGCDLPCLPDVQIEVESADK